MIEVVIRINQIGNTFVSKPADLLMPMPYLFSPLNNIEGAHSEYGTYDIFEAKGKFIIHLLAAKMRRRNCQNLG
jgi:hypothetical protein